MLYFLHRPSGNVVIRTSNAYIVLQYQRKGWLTATTLNEVIAEHPEWRDPAPSLVAPTPEAPPRSFAATLFILIRRIHSI
jgi:hypothetical protein